MLLCVYVCWTVCVCVCVCVCACLGLSAAMAVPVFVLSDNAHKLKRGCFLGPMGAQKFDCCDPHPI